MNRLLIFSLLMTILGATNLEAKDRKPSKQSQSNIIVLNKDDFTTKVCDYNSKEWKYLGDRPAIIDFYADWCGPCRLLSPRLEDVAAEYKDSIYVYKIDIDEQQELATMFNIRSIPTLLFIPMKEEPQLSQGLITKEILNNVVKDFLLKKETVIAKNQEENNLIDEEQNSTTIEKNNESQTEELAYSETNNTVNGFKKSEVKVEYLK